MSISASEVKAFVQSEDDFGHELRVMNVYSSVASNCCPGVFFETPEHGKAYIDPVSGKMRQFDYRFWILGRALNGAGFDKGLFLAVECKNLHESSPLILCGSGCLIMGSAGLSYWLHFLSHSGARQSAANSIPFRLARARVQILVCLAFAQGGVAQVWDVRRSGVGDGKGTLVYHFYARIFGVRPQVNHNQRLNRGHFCAQKCFPRA
jgi:hypothetical protein